MNKKVKQLIEEYTGKEIKTVLTHPDPKVPGVYAARAVDFYKKGEHLDFIVTPAEGVDGGVEETEYDTWPPKSGELKFFT